MAKKKKKLLNAETKQWLVSSLLTFLGGFFASLLPFLSTISTETLTHSAVSAVLIVAVRSGFKAIQEKYFATTA